jgi:subtilisin family serine protease
LIFAAAGNEGKNVDATDGIGPVKWEKTWFTPCENSGVICVGGLHDDDIVLDPDSNYGAEHVDIYAPYTMWLGPDPDSAANSVQVMHGTSFSSPFVAGVAALIWAANPSLSQKGVRDILYQTANASSDDRVARIVNAHDAVRAALGPVAPSIHFSYPLRDGYEMPLGTRSLSVFVEDVEDGHPCCTIAWYSDVDGYLGAGNTVSVAFDTIGTHVIEATATDSDGLESMATLVLQVVNAEPKAEILRPTAGETVFRGQPFRLRGVAADQNEPDGELDCSALLWDSDVASDPFPQTGCDVEVIFSSTGPRTLTLIATDSQGATSVVTASLEVVAPPLNLPPVVRITSPTGGAATPWNRPSTLTGTATDPEGDEPLVYTWTVTHPLSSAPLIIGNGPTVEWTPSEMLPRECNIGTEATVRLTVRDRHGNSASDFVYLLWQLAC